MGFLSASFRTSVALFLLGPAAIVAFADPVHAAVFNGTSGDDTLFGTNSSDVMSGEGGTDNIFGRKGRDVLSGGGGDLDLDMLFGSVGADTLIGDEGSDVLVDDDATSGDQVAAGSGSDTVFAADGSKTRVDCGPNTDTAYVDGSDVVDVSCEGVIDGDIPGFTDFGSNGRNTLTGTSLGENLFGKGDNDKLFGGAGGDALFGGGGRDRLFGEADSDFLIDDDGTAGDRLDGGPGDDQILAADGAADVIDCGEGAETAGDKAYVDLVDEVINCEIPFTAT